MVHLKTIINTLYATSTRSRYPRCRSIAERSASTEIGGQVIHDEDKKEGRMWGIPRGQQLKFLGRNENSVPPFYDLLKPRIHPPSLPPPASARFPANIFAEDLPRPAHSSLQIHYIVRVSGHHAWPHDIGTIKAGSNETESKFDPKIGGGFSHT